MDGNGSGFNGELPRPTPIKGRFDSEFFSFRAGMRLYILIPSGVRGAFGFWLGLTDSTSFIGYVFLS